MLPYPQFLSGYNKKWGEDVRWNKLLLLLIATNINIYFIYTLTFYVHRQIV